MLECKMPHLMIPSDLGIRYAVLPGDPGRADTAAHHLEDPKLLASNREFRTYSGRWKGMPVLITSTGIGAPSAAIAAEELIRAGVTHMIRIGSCGALSPELSLGDLLLVQGAVRDDGASAAYLPPQFPALADPELLQACKSAAAHLGISSRSGICRSHDCLYGDHNPEIYRFWSEKGVLGSDMETAVLFVLGALRKVHTASVLNVVAASQSSVMEDIASYTEHRKSACRTDYEHPAASGEEKEILLALEALFLCFQTTESTQEDM